MTTFVAIDFETSHHKRDCACSVGLVRVEDGRLVERVYRLIKPPRRPFMFGHVHGLSWRDVVDQPGFAKVWRDISPILEGAEIFVAHNASFDKSVLVGSCESAGVSVPTLPFVCTVKLAKRAWGMKRNKLSDVCQLLNIPLRHHHALSDAEACAQIYLEAQKLLEATPRLF